MTSSQTEQLRLSLLRHLDANPTRFGLSASLLHAFIHTEGLRVTIAEVETELQYLADKGLATQVAKTISPNLHAWRITATGRDHRAGNDEG